MGRRYVRDKAGRFAAKGGGSKGKGGKMGKSAKNVKARAAYKNQAGKLREAKKAASGAAKGGDARRSAYANRQLGGAKSGMTRVTNRLTNKRAAKAKVSPKRERAATKARALGTERKLQKKNLASVKKAKATRAKTAAAKKNKSEIKMTRRQYSKVGKDFKSSDPKNPRASKFVEGKGTVSMPVKFVKKYNQTDAFTASKAKRGSAATKRDRILRTAERNIRKSAGIKSPSFDRRAKRMKMAENIMTKSKGGSTAWKQFYSAYR